MYNYIKCPVLIFIYFMFLDSTLIASKYELYLKKDEQFAEYFNDFLLSPVSL